MRRTTGTRSCTLTGGGCLRNLGSHCFDLFLQLTGEPARVTGAQLSARALGQRVEDYASVQLRTAGGVLGTIELGNTVPYAGSDGEFKIAGRDGILVAYHDDTLRLITADGEETVSAPPAEPLYPAAVRAIIDGVRRGAPAPVSCRNRSKQCEPRLRRQPPPASAGSSIHGESQAG